MSFGKHLAGAVITIGIIKVVDRPEFKDAAREVKTALEAQRATTVRDQGPTMTAAGRGEMTVDHRGRQPEIRVRRRPTPRTGRSLAGLYRAREQARAKVTAAVRNHGRTSRPAIEAWAAYQRADAAYHAQLQRTRRR